MKTFSLVCYSLYGDFSESYGEDIGAADTENSDNFSDENEYEEDSFIDDSDPEVFAPSPSTSDESMFFLFCVLFLFHILSL